MQKKKKERSARRQYFINRKFQSGFFLKFFLVLTLGGVLSIAITMLMTNSTLTSSFEGSRLVIEKTSVAILPSVVLTNVITTCVVGITAFFVTLFVSHKIAGPMYRFESDLQEISGGDLSKKIHIRNGDQFGAVAESLNGMIGSINQKLSEVRDDLEEVSKSAVAHDLPRAFIDDIEKCRRNLEAKFKL